MTRRSDIVGLPSVANKIACYSGVGSLEWFNELAANASLSDFS
jgi:hypothetical protein